jgi:hypothetical protein
VSIHAISAVFAHSQAQHDCRLTMLAIAEFAHDDGVAWRSQETIAERAGCTTRTVRSCLRALEGIGEIETRTIQSGRRRFNAYRLLLPGLKDPDDERLERQGFALSAPWTTGKNFRPSESDDRKSATATTGNLRPKTSDRSSYRKNRNENQNDVAADEDAFDALIAEVGTHSSRQRLEWETAFGQNRDGFARVVEDALRGDRPAALLTQLVREDAHLAPGVKSRRRGLSSDSMRDLS